MQKVLKIAVSLTIWFIFLSGISACSSLRFPGVYKVTIQQGNYLEEDMIEKLKPGLTKEQVRYIMGTPLIEDTFNQNQWDYYYNVKLGDEDLRTNHFTVYFENDTLTHWDGDYTPINKQVEKDQQEALDQTKKKKDARLD
ncbi:Outer membrane protein assembly factor BamE [Thalassocella blandensis]|nr:Outer membrane protein assembly factor BamE [Thalassocella blandensis]